LTGPIGVFDSGVGGLTVLRYSLQCASALIERGVRCLVVACNTVSASALDALRRHHPELPVIGVIEPGAQAAVAASVSQHIAVIATEGTVAGDAYKKAIHRFNPSARVRSQACSLFVSVAEEGWTEGPIAEAIARRYLDPLFQSEDAPDTLVLGCTHFPALKAALSAVLPATVNIVDSAATTAAAVFGQLHAASRPSGGAVQWLATDGAARFARVSGTFLGENLAAEAIEIIDL
jgi:glutamate racemase